MYIEDTKLGPSFKSTFGIPAEKFCDVLLTMATQKFHLDIFAFEEWLANKDKEFLPEKCMYKGKKNISTNMYIQEKYGESALHIVKALI
ncbi:MAG: hypothetical protein WC222_11520 [Parachlamydiales bacterium]